MLAFSQIDNYQKVTRYPFLIYLTMKIRGKQITILQLLCLMGYYGFARFLPGSYSRFLGG